VEQEEEKHSHTPRGSPFTKITPLCEIYKNPMKETNEADFKNDMEENPQVGFAKIK